MKLPRRGLLRSILAAAAFGLATGLAHVLWRRSPRGGYPFSKRPYAEEPGLLRPPGALPEAAFLAACIRCSRCQDACEPGAIRYYTEADGLLYHTPFVDPAWNACTLCLKCGPACPTGALKPLEDRSEAAMGSVELYQELCLSYKAKWIRDEQALLVERGRKATESEARLERRGPCGECYMVCPLRGSAIRLEPGRLLAPMVFPESCVGCGLCEEICRTVVRGDPAIRVVRTRRPLVAA